MNSFANQVALITGAGSGLGRALASALAREGAVIAALDLRPEPLAALAAELPGRRVHAAVADVTDRPALDAAVRRLCEEAGPPELLFASAGVGKPTPAVSFPAAVFEEIVRVNLIGVANSIAAVLPEMIERRRGHLVGLSSLASFRGLPGMAGYCASKAGLNALLDSFRVELKPHGIHVTTVCPGWVRTPMTADIPAELPHLLEVDAAARLILEAVRRRRPFYAFPAPSVRRVRLLRWLPCRASDWLTARSVRLAKRGAAG